MGAYFLRCHINYINGNKLYLYNGKKFDLSMCFKLGDKYYPRNAQILTDGLSIDSVIVKSTGLFYFPPKEDPEKIQGKILNELIEPKRSDK